jgi:hypothetical protein
LVGTWEAKLVFQGEKRDFDVAILKRLSFSNFDGYIQPFEELQIAN